MKMETKYQEVNTDDEDKIEKETSVQSILKQTLICSSTWTHCFLAGLCRGAPTVFIPQMNEIRKQANSTAIIDDELGSWLYTTPCISVLPWVIILPLTTKYFGRKLIQVTTFVVCMIIFIILYCSNTPKQILIAAIFEGYLRGANYTIANLIMTEFSSPRLRGLFLAIGSASFFWGMWVANVIGTFFNWKYIPLFGMICSVSLVTSVFFPESAFWLASKGRFDDCRAAFRWIHGLSAEKQLRELISVQEDQLKMETTVDRRLKSNLRSPELYKPLILSITAVIQYVFSGKVVSSLYILDIFKNIMSSEHSTYMAMLILDGVTVFSMYIGSYLTKILKRRTLYLSTSCTGVTFLFIISLYLFLIKLKIFAVNNYISLALFTIYSLSMSCGPMILSTTIYEEIISRKFQASCYIIIGLTLSLSYSILLKFTPNMFASLGLDGTFLFFGVTCGLASLYLYLFLPETKDKTHWEIEEFFKDKKRGRIPVEVNEY